ncbi:MAG: hypothetical protein HDR44_00465, partial [Allobaculum sp.]|nr:hypothetical protein [Allobaculum sp.]
MNKKKLFGVLASAAMLLNATPLSVFAEEMVEVGPTGTVVGADPTNVALNSSNFPDNNLLNAIKSQNVSAATAADVKELEVPNSVQSLEGLQYLTNLESFTMINNNYIQSVDLSNNTSLTGGLENANGTVVDPELPYSVTYTAPVTIQNNGVLTSVTLPNDEDLTAVVITGNASLNEIDLSPAVLLEDVILSNNSIDELNLSKNPYIQFLNVASNDLYELDATGCKQLTALNVNNNKIFELKVPTAVPNGLQVLWANHNKLATFSVENLTKLVDLDLSNNMLKSLTLGSQAFSGFNVSYNHLAALKLNKVSFNGTKPIVSPQNLYANATDAAVNIKDYDPSFDPDQATLPGDKPFNSNGIFNTTNHPDEGTLAQFTQSGTTIYYILGKDGKTISGVRVLLNGVFVPAGNYTLSPDPVAEGMTPAEFNSTPITITAVKGTHYTGSVIIPNANKKGKAISNPTELIIKATASGTMNKDEVTVVVDPTVLLAATGYELTNAQYTVNKVTGQAVVDGVTWDLKFTQVASDPTGYTWTAKATDATRQAAPIWNNAPTKVTISGEITVTADNLAGPLTTSFNNVVLEGENPSVTVSNQDPTNPDGTIGGDATIDVDNSGNAGDEEPGESDELAVTLKTDGTGITAVDGKTGVYTV